MIEVREERPTDHAGVARIVTSAFEGPAEANIVAAIRGTPAEVLSLVALSDGELCAHVLFSVVDPDDSRLRACALGPVAVDPARQALGIGSKLIRRGIEQIRAQGWPLLFVLGNPRYYGRFGFDLAAPSGWHYGSRELDRAFQVLRFDRTAPAGGERWVKYHPSFSS